MRCGVAILDSNLETGYAGVVGESPRPVTDGIASLDPDVLWWTNLDYDALRERSLSRSHIKSEGYLRRRMMHIRAQLGCLKEQARTQEAVVLLGLVLSRVLDRALDLGVSEVSLMGEYSLGSALRKDIIRDEPPTSPELSAGLMNAYWTHTLVQERIRREERRVPVGPPALNHAMALLSRPVPRGRWTWRSASSLPHGSGCAEWLAAGSEELCLARATVKDLDRGFASLLGFRGNQFWFSSPDLLIFSRYAKLEVEGVYFCDGMSMPEGGVAVPGLLGEHDFVSCSGGLFFENWWIALASVQVSRGVRYVTPRAVWLRGYDRAILFALSARILSSRIARIASYGSGGILLAPHDVELRGLGRRLSEVGVVPVPGLGLRDQVEAANV